jgi:hypothetical protein
MIKGWRFLITDSRERPISVGQSNIAAKIGVTTAECLKHEFLLEGTPLGRFSVLRYSFGGLTSANRACIL